jgi:3-hydroxyacyl-[acyl-carrier-protein] dehydratase
MKPQMMTFDINEILKYLPHRYPFLLIDRVLELELDKRILALKNVTYNEPFFTGHFPHLPVMPGVMVLEAMAQAAGVLSFATMGRRSDDNSVFYFAGIDDARFKRPVGPGDQLKLEVEIMRKSRMLWKFKGVATVDGQTVAEAELMCALRELG